MKLEDYWGSVRNTMTEAVGENLDFTAKLVLLHDTSDIPNITRHQNRWLSTALAMAKMGVLRLWKSKSIRTHRQWLEEMYTIANYEKLIYKISNRLEQFEDTWGCFLK